MIAKKLFEEKFYDENRYRLGKVGRFRINRKIGLAIPTVLNTLTVADFVACLKYLLDLRGQDLSETCLDGASIRGAHVSGVMFPKELLATEIALSLEHGTRMRYR